MPEEAIWTSALATAQFLADQRPGGTAYVVGEAGLTTALHDVGYVMTDRDPDYVVLGETRTYSFEAITRAIRLIDGGARFIATNPDPSGPSPAGTLPATGSVAALITHGDRAPALLHRQAQPADDAQRAQPRSRRTPRPRVMVGDRMDTDVISGLEAGLRTVLVLTGSTRPRAGRALPLPADPGRRLDRRPRARSSPSSRPRGSSEHRPAVLHLAEVAHWQEALRTGEYRWSTLGRTLEEEGFIHCSTPEQVPGVLARYYATYAGDLALLTVDPGPARAPLQWDVVNTVTGERFPHVYGPITPDAVTATQLLHPPHGPGAPPAGED